MRVPACFLGMIHQRHRNVADQLVRELDGDPKRHTSRLPRQL